MGPDVRSGHAYLDGTVGNGLLDAAVLSLRHTRVTQYPLDAHERESDGMHLAGSTQERLLAGVWQNRAGTVAHPRVLRGDEAQLAARAEHNVDAEFLAFMSQFNEAPDGVQALRQRLPEPACAKRGVLLQAQAAVAILVLPGLARRMQQSVEGVVVHAGANEGAAVGGAPGPGDSPTRPWSGGDAGPLCPALCQKL